MTICNDGTVELENGLRFAPRMRREVLEAMLAAVDGLALSRVETQHGDMLFLPPCEAAGGVLAPACQLVDERLAAVWFWVQRAGEGSRSAAQQRALLFACLGREDPEREGQHAVVLQYPNARAMIATEPRAGDAVMRISYR